MFKKMQAFFIKKKADKKMKEAKTTYVMGHIMLILSNNLKAMQSVSEQQKVDLYNLYSKTLFNSMTDDNKLLFNKALNETNKALEKLMKGTVDNNHIQIQRQLNEIFRGQQ